jgi:ribonuclease HII
MKGQRTIDRFTFERELWRNGLTLIAGVDEVGRGPLAGPVVAAAVMLPLSWLQQGLPKTLKGLNDSKQLSPAQRETFFSVLTTHSEISFAIAQEDASRVDLLNILQATFRAINKALAQLRPPPQHVLADGTRVKSVRFPQTPLVKGDARSYSIAAASVIAKVTRDRLMRGYDRQWPVYGFAEHKGYGTTQHLAALARHGPCPIHRRSFSPLAARKKAC